MFRWFRIDPEKAQRAETQFQNWGMGFVLIGRMIPGGRTIINIPAGLARMPDFRFPVYTLIGAYLWKLSRKRSVTRNSNLTTGD